MEVLRANAHCVHEVMVHLVEIRIEESVMHQFVEEMETYIFCDHQENQLEYQCYRVGQFFSLETKLYIFVHP